MTRTALVVVLAVGALMLCGRFVAARGAVASSEPSSQPATAPATALATAPTSAPTTGPITDASGWTVIFRSDDPIVWNANAGEPSDEDGYALEMSALPEGTRYLRMKRMDSGESVIIQITRQQVIEGATLDGDVQWRPATPLRGGGQERSQLLGIVRRSWLANANNEHLIVYSRNWRGYRGWGFSKPVGTSMKQTYSWDGHPIDEPTVFEVAVKENDLDEEESGRLITDARRILAQNAPGTKIERQQASIYVMAVGFDSSGAVIGGAQELTLTAIPGAPRGNTAVAFVPASGEARRATLDDAVWAVRLDHPRWEASKANLRLTPELHDATVAGAPLGAAAGVLLRSMLEGFEIDPGVAITGDVNPDGSLRPVTGIGGRLRAAPLSPSRCGTLILPSGSEPQLADALVFNGWGTLVKVQAIAADSLELAAVDRGNRAVRAGAGDAGAAGADPDQGGARQARTHRRAGAEPSLREAAVARRAGQAAATALARGDDVLHRRCAASADAGTGNSRGGGKRDSSCSDGGEGKPETARSASPHRRPAASAAGGSVVGLRP